MTRSLPRVLMALAVHCLGDQRRDWALAMQAEFETAQEDGRPLLFSVGCLIAAWRVLPRYEEGRFTIASGLLTYLLILPTAAFLLSNLVTGFPHSYLGAAEAQGVPLLNEGTRFAVPSLMILMVLLVGAQLRLAWLLLEGDWVHVAATATMTAAATVTLLVLTSVGFAQTASSLLQAAALSAEFAGVAALARWHARFSRGAEQVRHA